MSRHESDQSWTCEHIRIRSACATCDALEERDRLAAELERIRIIDAALWERYFRGATEAEHLALRTLAETPQPYRVEVLDAVIGRYVGWKQQDAACPMCGKPRSWSAFRNTWEDCTGCRAPKPAIGRSGNVA